MDLSPARTTTNQEENLLVINLDDEQHSSHENARQKPIKCLRRDIGCTSSDCERVEECTNPQMNTDCFVVMKEVHDSSSDPSFKNGNTSIKISSENEKDASRFVIIEAGCWSGAEDCEPPIDLEKSFEDKLNNYEKNTQLDYKIPKSLLNPSIQQSCIRYEPAADDIGALALKNQTFCCCRFDECNRYVHISRERSPAILLSQEFYPKVRNSSTRTSVPNKHSGLTHGEVSAIIFTSLVFILLLLLFAGAYVYYQRRRLKRRKAATSNGDNLPSVRYSKANSDDFDVNNGLLSNNNGLLTTAVGIGQPGGNEIVQDYLNNRLPPNVTLTPQMLSKVPNANATTATSKPEAGSDFKPPGQVTIGNTMSMSEILAQKQQQAVIKPSDVLLYPPHSLPPMPPSQSNAAQAPMNIASLLNDLKEIEDFQNNDDGFLGGNDSPSVVVVNQPHRSSSQEPTIGPSRLRASHIELIEKISAGQFSNVWKAKCRRLDDQPPPSSDVPLDEYAVKVFGSHQKSSWANEKDIYNVMSTNNEFILKYYGSDVNEKGNDQRVSEPSHFTFVFPGSPFNPNPNHEYWLITEYHPAGSLYDYLKQHRITWPQMVHFTHSIVEGLAYLHTEQQPQLSGAAAALHQAAAANATPVLNHASYYDPLAANASYLPAFPSALATGSSSGCKTFAIAHRDLKSKNILVKNDCQTCCIADFGLALKLSGISKLSSAEIRSKVGTRRYMSPELLEGAIGFNKDTFLRIDVYACALVLWEVISRGDFYDGQLSQYKLPFEDEVGQNPTLEEMKEIVVDKCLRPVIKPEWTKYHQIASIARTIEECWDIDLDARISSECAASRIRKILKTLT